MNTQDPLLFEEYKPLRNHLRKIFLDDSLYVLWAYAQNLQFKSEFPKDIEVGLEWKILDCVQKARYCSAWEIEALVKEVLINASDCSGEKILKKWNYFIAAINKLKVFEREIHKKYVITSENALVELFRTAHRQFPWQHPLDDKFITRYYKIFGDENLNEIIKNKTGLTIKEIYIITLTLAGAYLTSPGITLPMEIDLKEVNSNNIDKFIKCFASTIHDLRQKLQDEQEINDKFFYSFGSIRSFPLIKMDYREQTCLVCPLPTLLFWRTTNGIYYEICGERGFDKAFGKSFENYVGEVIIKSNTNTKIKHTSEINYCKNQNRSSDWIVYDDETILFIECKTKRLRLPAKLELGDQTVSTDEFGKMADMIKQVYKTIADYKSDKYESFKYDKKKKIFPLIITLEDWYLSGLAGDKIINKIDILLAEKLREEKIDPLCTEEMPYSICSIEEFESVAQIIQELGIRNVFDKKTHDKEKRKWSFSSLIKDDEFEESYKNIKFLFSEDFEKIKITK